MHFCRSFANQAVASFSSFSLHRPTGAHRLPLRLCGRCIGSFSIHAYARAALLPPYHAWLNGAHAKRSLLMLRGGQGGAPSLACVAHAAASAADDMVKSCVYLQTPRTRKLPRKFESGLLPKFHFSAAHREAVPRLNSCTYATWYRVGRTRRA